MVQVLGPMMSRSPRLRRALWKGWYQFAAKRLRQDEWTFMNYGFAAGEANGETLELDAADEENRWSIQLYHKVVGDLDLAGADVLEVGSGRGGGSAYMARYYKPLKMLGVDYSGHSIALSRRLHASITNLDFQQGDAESLPCEDAAFDAVVNVESSHCYGSMEAFLSETRRVLRPGGHFLWADMRAPADRELVRSQFAAAGLTIVADEDITLNVVRGLDHLCIRNKVMLEKHVPKFLVAQFAKFAGFPGTPVYESLRTGRVSYLRFALQKPG